MLLLFIDILELAKLLFFVPNVFYNFGDKYRANPYLDFSDLALL